MDINITTLKKEVPLGEYIRDFVDVPRFLACCAECRGYGRTWACPPYDMDPNDIWAEYDSILLYAKKVEIRGRDECPALSPAELADAYNSILDPVKAELMEELYELEMSTPKSLALSAGGCDICDECTRQSGLPCRRPDKMRYSVESIGGDVLKTLTDIFGESVLWAENGRLPEHFILLGGLLKK